LKPKHDERKKGGKGEKEKKKGKIPEEAEAEKTRLGMSALAILEVRSSSCDVLELACD